VEKEFEADQLTLDEISQGWHYCYDWNGLLIGPGNLKMDSCKCKVNKKVHTEIRKTLKHDQRQTR
jgi:hypothetical protein